LGQSSIDLTLTNSYTFDILNNWKIEEIETNSDHSYITFDLNFTTNNSNLNGSLSINANISWISELVLTQLKEKYSTKRVDWNKFSECIKNDLIGLKSEINSVNNESELEDTTVRLMKTIISACNQVVPKHKSFKKSNHWWTPEIADKRKQVNSLRRQFQRTLEPNLRQTRRQNYYNEKTIYENMIKNSKTESWRKFYYESKTWGIPFKLINNKLKIDNSIPIFLKSDGHYTQTPIE